MNADYAFIYIICNKTFYAQTLKYSQNYSECWDISFHKVALQINIKNLKEEIIANLCNYMFFYI